MFFPFFYGILKVIEFLHSFFQVILPTYPHKGMLKITALLWLIIDSDFSRITLLCAYVIPTAQQYIRIRGDFPKNYQ